MAIELVQGLRVGINGGLVIAIELYRFIVETGSGFLRGRFSLRACRFHIRADHFSTGVNFVDSGNQGLAFRTAGGAIVQVVGVQVRLSILHLDDVFIEQLGA